MLDGSSAARLLFLGVVAVLLIFLVGPSLVMITTSFSPGEIIAFPPPGLSLRWYWQVFSDRQMQLAVANTGVVALVSTVVGTAAGTFAAIAMSRYRIRWRVGIEFYLLLPFVIPLTVEAVGIFDVYNRLDLLGQRWAIGIAVVAANLPFVIGTVSAAANRLDPSIEDAAASCGARPIERFFTITLPSLMPGIMAGALIMFITGINEFVVSAFLVDVHTMTMPVEVFNSGRGTTTPAVAAISVFYTVISLGAVMVIDRLVGIESFLRSSR